MKQTTLETNVTVIPINSTDFVPKKTPNYIQTNNEEIKMDIAMNSTNPKILVGPKGIGKTLCIESYAYQHKIPLIRHDCSEDTKKYDLYGSYNIINGQTFFELGVIPTAIETANQTGQAILVLEEFNALTNEMQKILNPILDYRKSIVINRLNKTYTLKDDCKLLVVATMNPSYYAGTNEINEDIKSRFGVWKWDYPKEENEKKILYTKDIPKVIIQGMIQMAFDTRNAYAKETIEYALSTRDLDLFFTEYRTCKETTDKINAFELAFEQYVINKYDTDEDIKYIQERKDSIFGNDIDGLIRSEAGMNG